MDLLAPALVDVPSSLALLTALAFLVVLSAVVSAAALGSEATVTVYFSDTSEIHLLLQDNADTVHGRSVSSSRCLDAAVRFDGEVVDVQRELDVVTPVG